MRDLSRRIALSAIAIITACSYTPPKDDTPDGPVLPTVQFEVAASLADENVSDLKIAVKLSEPSTSSVDFKVTGGIASQGADFAFINGSETGTLTFSGVTENIELMISNDGLEEPNESIEITLENPQGATLGETITHTVNVSADILPRVKFTNTATTRDEDVTGATLDLQLDIAPVAPISIDLALGGGATAIADYTLAAQTVTFAIGQTTAQLGYGVVVDTRDENNEIIAVDLASPIGVVIDTSAAHTEHTIVDDDATPTVSFVTAAVTQLESVASATQTVQLSAASNLTVTVDFAQTGTASSNDIMDGGTGTLTFAPGVTTQTIPITVVDDARDELATETVVMTLSNPSNATVAAPSAHTLSITDNDDPPAVTFGTPTTAATEGDPALTIPVTLTGNATDLTVTVDFARNNTSTATATTDFTFDTASSLSFAPGVTTQDITVSIVDDDLAELDETLVITLSNFTNSDPGATTTHTVTITDDDCLGTDNFRVCPDAAPAGNATISGAFDTDNPANCEAAQPLGWTTSFGQASACFVIADTITVANAGLVVTGSRPLVLAAGTSITVVGVIDGSATGSVDGPGGASSLCKVPVAPAESSADGGGGGAGGSFMTKGGNGATGNNNNQANGSISPAADAVDPVVLRGGCHGATGGTGPGEAGTGGAAGGAIYLVAPTITIGNKIDVSGSGGLGGAFDAGGGGGGGTGGMILIDATTTLNFTGTLMSNGAGGGQGADNNTSGESGFDPATFNVSAQGGNTGGAGGAGGRGHRTGANVTNGTNGGSGQGAGGGGGAGGFIKSSKALAGGNVSAGKIVQN